MFNASDGHLGGNGELGDGNGITVGCPTFGGVGSRHTNSGSWGWEGLHPWEQWNRHRLWLMGNRWRRQWHTVVWHKFGLGESHQTEYMAYHSFNRNIIAWLPMLLFSNTTGKKAL